MPPIRWSWRPTYGVDQFRYFLLREVNFGQDGSWSEEAIVTRSNAELANSFGNLAQRTLSQIFKNCDAYLPAIHGHNDEDAALFDTVGEAVSKTIPAAFEDLALSQAVEAWITAVFACNAYIDAQAPWALKKTDPERMETVLRRFISASRNSRWRSRRSFPKVPTCCSTGWGSLRELRTFAGIGSHWYSPLAESDFRLEQPQGLFPRLEMPIED